jgi:hypothetical protein
MWARPTSQHGPEENTKTSQRAETPVEHFLTIFSPITDPRALPADSCYTCHTVGLWWCNKTCERDLDLPTRNAASVASKVVLCHRIDA